MEIMMTAVCALIEMALLMLALIAAGIAGMAGYVIIGGVARAIVDDYRKRRKHGRKQ